MRRNRMQKQPACRLLLVRHPMADGHGRFQGQRDVPLTAEGRRQLPGLLRKLSHYSIDAVYSSDLARTLTTAEVAARKLGIQCESRRGLREMAFGCWQGMSWEQIEKRYPRLAARWMKEFPRYRIPRAERFDEFVKRVTKELRAIVSANRGKCALVVTHAGVIRVAVARALGIQLRHLFRIGVDSCRVSVIDYFERDVLVWCVNG